MELSAGHAAPIYRHERSRSRGPRRSLKPALLKAARRQKKKDGKRGRTARTEDDRWAFDRPSSEAVVDSAGQEQQDQQQALDERHYSASETASTITLPEPPPPPLRPRNPARLKLQASSSSPLRPALPVWSRPAVAAEESSSPFTDLVNSINSNKMAAAPPVAFSPGPQYQGGHERHSGLQHGNGYSFHLAAAPHFSTSGLTYGMPPGDGKGYPPPPNAASAQFNPQATYQHIQEMTAKRVSTLDYLRKTHEGRVYWYNTLLFSKSDIGRLPSFDPKKLSRRATNFLLLGLSLPTTLDLNMHSPLEYLRALNALLTEFEAYQQIHPPDGSNSSSLSRARIPRFFKQSSVGATKGRRSSSAADIGAPMNNSETADLKQINGSAGGAQSGTTAFAASEQELLPGEEYVHLLTPSLPFDPDFFEVFATLCDVLIDCYMRICTLIPSPVAVAPGIAEAFAKADARMRKVIVAGVIKEFEDATRVGVKGEVAGIGKVVFGGLM